jgi:hypothetical protein
MGWRPSLCNIALSGLGRCFFFPRDQRRAGSLNAGQSPRGATQHSDGPWPIAMRYPRDPSPSRREAGLKERGSSTGPSGIETGRGRFGSRVQYDRDEHRNYVALSGLMTNDRCTGAMGWRPSLCNIALSGLGRCFFFPRDQRRAGTVHSPEGATQHSDGPWPIAMRYPRDPSPERAK